MAWSRKKSILLVILVIFVCGVYKVVGLFFPLPGFKAPSSTKTDLCWLSFGSKDESNSFEYYTVANRDICYTERLEKFHDWHDCTKTPYPSSCIRDISARTSTYLCDKLTGKVQNACNRELLELVPNVHELAGIEKYRVAETITLTNGEKFHLNPISIDGNSIKFALMSRHTCSGEQNPPIMENLIGGTSSFIYITNCQVENNLAKISFFKYSFPVDY